MFSLLIKRNFRHEENMRGVSTDLPTNTVNCSRQMHPPASAPLHSSMLLFFHTCIHRNPFAWKYSSLVLLCVINPVLILSAVLPAVHQGPVNHSSMLWVVGPIACPVSSRLLLSITPSSTSYARRNTTNLFMCCPQESLLMSALLAGSFLYRRS